MIKVHSGSAVPRYQVFVLGDGSFVVQWSETSVQDLITGVYHVYSGADFGHRISDYELDRLKEASVVEDYDQAYVWIYALPEQARFGVMRTQQQSHNKGRSYYINTTLPAEKFSEVQAGFDELKLVEGYCCCIHDGLVSVMAKDATPFNSLKDAETAQRKLQSQMPELFENAAVAFTESAHDFAQDDDGDEEQMIDLDALIASQTDTSRTEGRSALVACKDGNERRAIVALFEAMAMQVESATTAQETLNRLEESPVDVLVMDLRLDDMHGWAMLGKIREIGHAARTHVIALAEPGTGDQVFALTVAKVDVYLHKPISMAQLRQTVWSALKEQTEN